MLITIERQPLTKRKPSTTLKQEMKLQLLLRTAALLVTAEEIQAPSWETKTMIAMDLMMEWEAWKKRKNEEIKKLL
jgi:hypothetical protein